MLIRVALAAVLIFVTKFAFAQVAISTTSPLRTGDSGSVVAIALSASGDTPPYSWAISSGSLPAGVSLSADGLLSGIPHAPGSYSFTVSVTSASASVATKQFAWRIEDGARTILPIIISSLAPQCTLASNPSTLAVQSSLQLTATCTKTPGSYRWTGPGITSGYTTTTGSISVMSPATAGVASYSVVAMNGAVPSNEAKAFVQVTANTPPTIALSSYPSSPTPRGNAVPISLTVADADSGQTIAAELLVNNVQQATTAARGVWSPSWIPALSGVYTVQGRITDATGTAALSVPIVVVVEEPPVASVTAPGAVSTVGAVAGSFAVSDSGAATYSIPIPVPPGAGGLSPQLSLVYSSHSGDGAFGVGWTLSGLSAITRCQKTIATDGYRDRINYDDDAANDDYCLDGERLIEYQSLGGNAIEYRTERESYARIIGYSEYPNNVVGTSRFRVWAKDGRILDFGARFWIVTHGWAVGQANTVRVWPLDRMTDRAGNQITIDYESSNRGDYQTVPSGTTAACMPPPPTGGESFTTVGSFPENSYFPTYIAYSINSNYPGATRQYVRLVREARADISVLYDSGSGKTRLSERISRIETNINAAYIPGTPLDPNSPCPGSLDTYTGGTLVSVFNLSYSASPDTGRSRLWRVQQCDGANHCLGPTDFTWETGQKSFASGTLGANPNDNSSFAADFNGDGKTDIIWSNGSTVTVCRVNSTCSQLPLPASYQPATGNGLIQVGDFNGDGKADLVFGAGQGSGGTPYAQYWVCLVNDQANGFSHCAQVQNAGNSLPQAPATWGANPRQFAVYGDFDGDGRIDIAFFLSGVVNDVYRVCLSQSSSTVSFSCYDAGGPRANSLDGSQAPSGDGHVLIADFNGDGKADLLQRKTSDDNENQWRICLSQFGVPGITFTTALNCATNWQPLIKGELNKLGVYDFNGDGLADLIAPVQPTEIGYFDGAWRVCISRGDGGFYDVYAGQSNCDNSFWHGPAGTTPGVARSIDEAFFGDFNGDGRTDIAVYASGSWQICLSKGVDFSCTSPPSNWPTTAGAPTRNATEPGAKVGDFNGDGRSDIATFNNGFVAHVTPGPSGDRISSITDGLAVTTQVTYKPLTDSTIYTGGTGSAGSDSLWIGAPMFVVASATRSNGIGGTNSWSYTYEGLKASRVGRGVLGFLKRNTVDPNGIKTTITYNQLWPLNGRPDKTEKYAPDSANALQLVNQTTHQYSTRETIRPGGKIVESFQVAQEESSWELNGYDSVATRFPTVRTDSGSWDAYGNPLLTTVTTYDGAVSQVFRTAGHVKTTTNSYFAPDTANWFIGKLQSSSVQSTLPNGLGSLTRSSSFTYYCVNGVACGSTALPGAVASETVEPSCVSGTCTDRSLWTKTSYTYDGRGNVSQKRIDFSEAANQNTGAYRITNYTFDSAGQFLTATNSGGSGGGGTLRSRSSFDPRFGSIVGEQTPDLSTTYSEYDSFGRLVRRSSCIGSSSPIPPACVPNQAQELLSQTTYFYEAVGLTGFERYRVRQVTSGAPERRSYFDALQREVRSESATFSGGFASMTTSFDALGRKALSSRPYASTSGSSVIRQTVFGYDVLNRVISEQPPVGLTSVEYAVVARTDPATGASTNVARTITRQNRTASAQDQQSTTHYTNSQGNVFEIVDATGKSTIHAFDPFGNVTCITPSGLAVSSYRCSPRTNVQVATSFDIRGRKVSMNDPDMGVWSYSYSGVGELKSQTDGNGDATALSYDGLGRLTLRQETGSHGSQTSRWTFDSSSACTVGGSIEFGKLCSAGVDGGAQEQYFYDSHRRQYKKKSTVLDIQNVSRDFYAYTLRDAKNRIGYIAYPQMASNLKAYGLRYGYAATGKLSSIVQEHDNRILWSKSSEYDDGQSYQTTLNGAVVTRGFDTMGRPAAVGATDGATTVQSQSFAFDYLGNLTSRSETGVNAMSSTYGYDLLNRLVACSGTCASASYAYDAFGNRSGGTLVAGTHRLGSIGSRVFSYDSNGQLLSDGASTVGWTSFGQPSFIAGPGNSPRIDFRYGLDRQRTVEQVSNGPTILYVGNQFFEYRTAPEVSGRAYIHSPDGVIATVVLAANADTYTDKSWFKDHLGSVSVERDGAANAYAAFDEWGARRGTYIPGGTSRGFTGHEHLDAFSLVHMNGRIYDPSIGRFLSPDPIVQDPNNPQNLNRYSYVLNNPLSMTDPTGYSWWTKWRKPLLAAVVAIASYGAASEWAASSIWSSTLSSEVAAGANTFEATMAANAAVANSGMTIGAVSGAASGFAAGGVMGGNIQSAVYGAFTGAVGGGIGGIAGDFGVVGEMTGGAVNGYLQTGRSDGALRGALAGLVPADLGFTKAYLNDAPANVAINVARDGIRGAIAEGSAHGFWKGIAYGQGTTLAGHLVGLATTWSRPTFYRGAFLYEGELWSNLGAITLGNVIVGQPQFRASRPLAYEHERNHAFQVQERMLGAAYLPLHLIDVGVGCAGGAMGFGTSWYALEEHVQAIPYSSFPINPCATR